MKKLTIMKKPLMTTAWAVVILPLAAQASLLTDPDDPRTWQGASVGTFAALYYGSNTLANRQLVIDNGLLDDGFFDATGFAAANHISGGGGCVGKSTDDGTGPDPYAYFCGATDTDTAADTIDDLWFQTQNPVGTTVFDLGFAATKAAVFPTIDHGPIPQEAIESTVYLSNDMLLWVEAEVQRVWLEGFHTNLAILWDGFTYAVAPPGGGTFRYASIIHGGPGALIDDGDDEINGLMGLRGDFTPPPAVPEPSTILLLGTGLMGGLVRYARPRK